MYRRGRFTQKQKGLAVRREPNHGENEKIETATLFNYSNRFDAFFYCRASKT